MLVVVPSDRVSVSGPEATVVPVEATEFAEIRLCAAATDVTSKVIEALVVPVAPVAVVVSRSEVPHE